MDNRLSQVFGKRPSRLRQSDLPNLAYALTVASRNLTPVSIWHEKAAGAPVVAFSSEWFTVAVLESDWRKIEPYVRDGVFTTTAYPVPTVQSQTNTGPSGPDRISSDPLYSRILGVLTMLFPDKYPTSDL